MVTASELYVKSIYDRFSYLATWLPNTRLKLGDVGTQQGAMFKRMTSLKEMGIDFKLRAGDQPLDFTYTSQSGVAVHTKAAGELAVGTTLPVGQAGVLIEFSQEGAFLFQAIHCQVDEIENKVALGHTVIQLYQERTWEPNWSVVDTVVKANSATIVVSNSHSAALELTAKTATLISDLANLDVGLGVNAQRGDVIQFLAQKGLMPLYRLSRLKQPVLTRIFGGARPIYFGGKVKKDAASTIDPDEDVWEAVVPG
jgi:hypothetical protein